MAGKQNVRFADLAARGWTRDLADWYLTANHFWYSLADVERAEALPEWSKDRRRAAAGTPVALTRGDLFRRGWTEPMIRDRLGDPDRVVLLNPSGTQMLHLWRSLRVEKAEEAAGWIDRSRAAMARRERSSRIAERRRAEVLAAVKSAADALSVRPPSSIEELRAAALAARQRWQDRLAVERGLTFPDRVDDADDETVRRWCANYLRHECSNYDRLLRDLEQRFRGVPGVRDVYAAVVRPKADEMAAAAIRRLDATRELASSGAGSPENPDRAAAGD